MGPMGWLWAGVCTWGCVQGEVFCLWDSLALGGQCCRPQGSEQPGSGQPPQEPESELIQGTGRCRSPGPESCSRPWASPTAARGGGGEARGALEGPGTPVVPAATDQVTRNRRFILSFGRPEPESGVTGQLRGAPGSPTGSGGLCTASPHTALLFLEGPQSRSGPAPGPRLADFSCEGLFPKKLTFTGRRWAFSAASGNTSPP